MGEKREPAVRADKEPDAALDLREGNAEGIREEQASAVSCLS